MDKLYRQLRNWRIAFGLLFAVCAGSIFTLSVSLIEAKHRTDSWFAQWQIEVRRTSFWRQEYWVQIEKSLYGQINWSDSSDAAKLEFIWSRPVLDAVFDSMEADYQQKLDRGYMPVTEAPVKKFTQGVTLEPGESAVLKIPTDILGPKTELWGVPFSDSTVDFESFGKIIYHYWNLPDSGQAYWNLVDSSLGQSRNLHFNVKRID